jgi:hypothetical protein
VGWPALALLAAVAGRSQRVASDRLATTSATLEAYTVKDRQGCLETLSALRQRMDNARAALKVGKVDGKNAASHLSSASEGLDDALAGTAHQPTPDRHIAPRFGFALADTIFPFLLLARDQLRAHPAVQKSDRRCVETIGWQV